LPFECDYRRFKVGSSSEAIQTVAVAGTVIEYSERGQGEPLLLVHAGGFADWFVPLAASHTLDDFRVIRVRRAGYGAKAPASHLSIRDHAAHLIAFADLLKIDAVHVVGHSSGALIAFQMAADRPQLVHSLMLIEPAACGPFFVPAFAELGERFIGPAMGAFAAGDLAGAFDTFMRGVGGDGWRGVIEQTFARAGYEQAVRESRFFFSDEVPACMEWQFESNVAEIRQPVLVVEGEDGRHAGLLSQQVTEVTTTLLPQAEVVLIPRSNHMLPLQEPDALGEALGSFARRHPIAASKPDDATGTLSTEPPDTGLAHRKKS
jgi:pimeloyl-ACP methyl ester carboxylesterase